MVLLIDTDVLIDHLRGRPAATRFLKSCLASGDRILCSVITHAELLAGMRASEEDDTRALLALFVPVEVSANVAEVAAAYRRQYGKSHGVLLPDALVAATARVHEARLYSTNVKHYPMDDLNVERPYGPPRRPPRRP